MTTKNMNTREIAMEALLEILEKGSLSHLVMGQVLRKYRYLEKQDRAFLSRLVEGTIERKLTLDYILNQHSTKVPVKKMKPVIRTILRMGVYQIYYMDGVPESAACNEAVKLAVKKGFSSLKGFVNGVLRSVAREKGNLSFPAKEQNAVLYYSVKYSMPEWIVEQWLEQYGENVAERMLEAGLERQHTTVRMNTSRGTREEILGMLAKESVTVTEIDWYPEAVYLSEYDSLEDLQTFQRGYLQVQDISSMMVAEACGIKEGDRIIDVCAAPGGKSLHAADKLRGTGHVEARDLTEYKVELMEENRQRNQFRNMSVKQWDALELDEAAVETADIVIADLPCSGLGVVGKKNDLKYNGSLESQAALEELQRQILMQVSVYVKPGGVLLYSTCTTNKKENEENVSWFLKEHPAFSLEPLTGHLPEKITGAVSSLINIEEQLKKGEVALLQGIFPSDGFFLARLKKQA